MVLIFFVALYACVSQPAAFLSLFFVALYASVPLLETIEMLRLCAVFATKCHVVVHKDHDISYQ